jgi:hypothetical protein
MAIGPGKYDDVATKAREMTNALGVIVIIFGGDKGNGFSLQAVYQPNEFMKNVPKMLRTVADQIDADLTGVKNGEPE